MEDKISKWRLILGQSSDPDMETPLEGQKLEEIDAVLEALYDTDRKGSLGPSAPNINRWLGDIRTYFPKSVVQLMQRDALEKLDIASMLLEPETLDQIEMDVHLAATLISLNQVMPDKSKEVARSVIKKLVDDLIKRLSTPMQKAVIGSLNKATKKSNPKLNEIDWHQTIRTNLKHYQKDLKTIIPDRLIGYGRKKTQLKHVILLVDQSGSMASSVIYACVFAAILAALPAIKTHLIAFDINVVDFTEMLDDPVEILFASQLGGGTDIGQALQYAQKQVIQKHQETILILISDLYEGGSEAFLLQKLSEITSQGTQVISLLALSDQGTPSFDHKMARQIASLGITSFACTPDHFSELMAAAIEQHELKEWASKNNIVVRN